MVSRTEGNGEGHGDHGVVFFIGKKRCESPTADLTVRVILTDFAKEDAAETTLVEKDGDDPKEYTDLDEVVHIKNGTHFTVYHKTPTPVS